MAGPMELEVGLRNVEGECETRQIRGEWGVSCEAKHPLINLKHTLLTQYTTVFFLPSPDPIFHKHLLKIHHMPGTWRCKGQNRDQNKHDF